MLMSALTILIIRHAEKPDEAWPGPGLTLDGTPDDKSLVIRGWQRAGSWSALFGAGLNNSDYPQPAVVYAANPKTTGPDTSQRPFQTVTPLAARLGLNPPDTTYAVGQEAALVAAILVQTGVVLVAWEHKAIARTILPLVVHGQSIPNIPAKWDHTRFDVVLRFDRSSPGSEWSFRQLFPCLLSGDSSASMA